MAAVKLSPFWNSRIKLLAPNLKKILNFFFMFLFTYLTLFYQEHHLQRAIVAGLIIPTPEVFQVEDVGCFSRCYPCDWKVPRNLIHMQRINSPWAHQSKFDQLSGFVLFTPT